MARKDGGPDRNEQAGGKKPRRSFLGNLFYWGAVLPSGA